MAMLNPETIIIVFEIETKRQLMLQALLQGEDGLGFVRCMDGAQQLWTTSSQIREVKDWLKCLPTSFNLRILDEYTWSKGEA